MDKEQIGIPKLRFPGFTDPWEQRRLGEVIVSEHKGKVKSSMKGGNTNYLETNYLNGGIAQKVNVRADVSKNDVLILWDGSKAGTVYHGFEGALGSTLKAYVPKCSGDFLYQILKKDQDKIYQRYRTPNIPHVIKNFTEKFIVLIPDVREQEKIAEFFNQLDSLIALHQRKLEHLKQQKNGLLQKMFPKNGESVPDVRFPGFTDPWEQRKLGEVADVRDGTHDSPRYINEGYPLLTSKNVGNGYINYDDVKYVSENDYVQINKRSKVDINDILMGMIGTIGNLALIREEPDFAIKNVALIKHTSNFDYQFLFQELQTSAISKELLSGMDGGTQKFVSLKKIRNLSVMLPSENEQKQIGAFFKQFDSLIALYQRKLEHLELLKKGLLQQMFV